MCWWTTALSCLVVICSSFSFGGLEETSSLPCGLTIFWTFAENTWSPESSKMFETGWLQPWDPSDVPAAARSGTGWSHVEIPCGLGPTAGGSGLDSLVPTGMRSLSLCFRPRLLSPRGGLVALKKTTVVRTLVTLAEDAYLFFWQYHLLSWSLLGFAVANPE